MGSENLLYPGKKIISNSAVIELVINHDRLTNTAHETAKKYSNKPIKA